MYDRIKGIDYFATIVGLRYNGSWRYQTFFGGIITSIMMFFAVGIITFFLIQFISRDNINMNFQTVKYYNPPKIDIGSNFSFAISMQYGFENAIKSNIIQISFEYVSFDLKNNKLIITPLPSKNCTAEMFSLASKQYVELGISNGVCVDTKNLTIEGSNINSYFSFLRAKFIMCNNQSFCLPLTNISTILSNFKPVANLYYLDSTFQPNDPNNFVFYYINNVNVNVTFNNAKENNVFFSKNLLSVQNGWIFPTSPIDYEVITIDSFRDLVNVRTADQMNLLNFNLMSSKNEIDISISYMQFSQFLANIGGIINNVTMIFSILVYYINNVSFQVKVAEDLFRFKNQQNTEIKEKIKKNYFEAIKLKEIEKSKNPGYLSINKSNNNDFDSRFEFGINKSGFAAQNLNNKEGEFSLKLNNQQEYKITEDRSANLELAEMKKNNTTLDHIKKEVDKKLDSKKEMNLTLTDQGTVMKNKEKSHFEASDMYYLYLCNCIRFFSKKFRQKQLVLDRIESYLNSTQDFSNLFQKIMEIDLIKFMLFNKDQLNIMKYLTKPEVVFTENKKDVAESATESFSKYYTSLRDIESCDYTMRNKYESEKLIQSLNNLFKAEANEVNLKLIKSFQKIFEKVK